MGRAVVDTVGGGVRVTETGPRRGLTPKRRRQFLALVSQGSTVANAATVVGVAVGTVYALRDRDEEFAAELSAARSAFGAALEDVAYQRAVVGVPTRFVKRDGTVIESTQVSDRLLERMLEAHDDRYKRDRGPTVIVNQQVLTTADLEAARIVGREQVEVLDELAAKFAEGERRRDEQGNLLGSGS